MPLQLENIEAAIPAAMKHFERMKWTDLAYELQDYPALRLFVKKHREIVTGGSGIQEHFKVFKSDIARNVGILEPQQVSFRDLFRKGDVPYRHNWTAWGWDLRELSMLQGPPEIVDYASARRIEALQSLAALWEVDWWGKPIGSSDDKTPFGLLYWIVFDDENPLEGFYGANPAGFPEGCAHLDADTYKHWRNWQAPYTEFTRDDLGEKLAKAAYKCRFIAAVPLPEPQKYQGEDYGYYTNFKVYRAGKRMAEEQNDALGFDLDPVKRPLFHGHPLTPVPYFDEDNETASPIADRDPIIGVCWHVTKVCFLRGWYMREIGPKDLDAQPAAQGYHLFCSWQSVVTNRRRNFILLKPAA